MRIMGRQMKLFINKAKTKKVIKATDCAIFQASGVSFCFEIIPATKFNNELT